MTVSSTVRQAGPFVGDALTTVFPFAFKTFTKADLVITLTVIATGAQSTLVLDSDFTVALNADQDASPGGSVTYNPAGVPMPAANNLTITSAVAQSQTVTLTIGGGFFPTVISTALDRIVILIQELTLRFSRGLAVAIGDTAPSALPSAAARALKALWFDASGNPIASSGSGTTPVSAAMAPVVAAATLPAARTALLIDAKTTVASAASPDIWTGTGGLIDYTGTGTAAGFPAAPVAGARRTLLCAAACLFTAGANMIIGGVPSGSTYTALAGDLIDVIAVTTTQFKLSIRPLNVSAVNGGFAFPATQVSSSGANTLDDYEEGQYLPVDNSSAGLTLSLVMDYTKIGRVVHIGLSGAFPATADVNNVQFSIPFTCVKTGAGVLFHGGASTGSRLFVVPISSNNCIVYVNAPGGQLLNSGASNSTFVGEVTYQAAT